VLGFFFSFLHLDWVFLVFFSDWEGWSLYFFSFFFVVCFVDLCLDYLVCFLRGFFFVPFLFFQLLFLILLFRFLSFFGALFPCCWNPRPFLFSFVFRFFSRAFFFLCYFCASLWPLPPPFFSEMEIFCFFRGACCLSCSIAVRFFPLPKSKETLI